MTATLLGVLLLSNRWTSWAAGQRLLHARDESDYARIALAAPALPSGRLPNQHAQVFAPNYVVGLLRNLTSLDVHTVFRVVSLVLVLAICACVASLFARLRLTLPAFALGMTLIVLNTYSLRYYLVAPGYVTDLTFVLSLALIMLGLLTARFWLILVAIAVAALARQSALPLSVGLAAAVTLVQPWCEEPRLARIGRSLAVIVVPSAAFVVLLIIAAPFSAPATPGVSGLTLVGALARLPRGAGLLVEHFGRVVNPLLGVGVLMGVVLAIRARARMPRYPATFWAGLVIGMAVWLQAVALNPSYSGHPERLAVLALIPFVVALATLLRELETAAIALSPGSAIAASALLAIGSLHYLYTWFGPATAAEGVALQGIAAVGAGVIVWRRLTAQLPARAQAAERIGASLRPPAAPSAHR